MIFNANWICRDVVDVPVRIPADVSGASVCEKTCRLVDTGGLKFEWLITLNSSARNCRLKLSEMRRIWLFLKREVSSPNSPGPIAMLRPALPRRVAGLGAAKHWVLI